MTHINSIDFLIFYLFKTKIPLIPFKYAYPEPLIGLIKYFLIKIEGKGIRAKYIQTHGLKVIQIKPQHLPPK